MREVIFILLFISLPFNSYAKDKVVLKVFHAGSLSYPFAKIEKAFENKYPYIDVKREASGSVGAIRKVTDLHKKCDIIAVADYTLIPKMLFFKYTNYVKIFARNELVICFTPKSRYKSYINSNNWYEILNKKDVKWGIANPNDDPCGYRSLFSIGLASLIYNDIDIVENLIGRYTNIKIEKINGKIFFKTQRPIKLKGNKLFIRPKSVELLGLLESGAIDYAFEYKSVAIQHGLLYIDLPPEINLGDFNNKNLYEMTKIQLFSKKIITGRPIMYGITTLKNSIHQKEGKLFEEFVTGEIGRRILRESYQLPVFPIKIIKEQ